MSLEQQLFEDGEVLGHFWLPHHYGNDDHTARGVLRWSPTDGADLRLIGPLLAWPYEVGGPPTIVHGRTVDREPLSLVDAWVSKVSGGGDAFIAWHSSTLIAGHHLDESDRWNRLVLRTANLHEWLPDTGIETPVYDIDDRGRTTRLQIEWSPPEERQVEFDGAVIKFAPTMETEWAYSPDWSVRTGLQLAIQVGRPESLDRLRRRFGDPLRSLVVFASDRPDAITFEVALANGSRARVLRQGEVGEPREWRPD